MNMTEHEMEQVIDKTVKSTLTRMGFEVSDPLACQQDMAFLRSARHLTGAAGTKAIMVLIGMTTLAVAGGIFIAIGRAVKQAVTS